MSVAFRVTEKNMLTKVLESCNDGSCWCNPRRFWRGAPALFKDVCIGCLLSHQGVLEFADFGVLIISQREWVMPVSVFWLCEVAKCVELEKNHRPVALLEGVDQTVPSLASLLVALVSRLQKQQSAPSNLYSVRRVAVLFSLMWCLPSYPGQG